MRGLLTLLVIFFFSHTIYSQNNISSNSLPLTPQQSISISNVPLDEVKFSPDGIQLATGGRDGAVRLWDADTGENTAILSGHSDWISSLAYSPDGTVLASAGRDNMIWLWNTKTATALRLIEDHQAEVKALTFTPDGTYIISGSLDGMVRLEPLGNPQATQIFDNFGGGVWSMTMSPDGTTLAIGSEDTNIWLVGLWDSDGSWLTPLIGHHTPVTTLAWSEDGTTLLSGEQNGHIRLWDVANAKQGSDAVKSTVLEGHLAPVMGVHFTVHENVAISTALDGSIRMWDIERKNELVTLHNADIPLTNLTVNDTGDISASVGTDGILNTWLLEQTLITDIIDSRNPVEVTDIPPTALPSSNIQPATPVFQPTQRPTVDPQKPLDIPALPPTSSPTLIIPSVNMQVSITTFPIEGITWAIDPWEKLVGHLQGTSWVNGTGNMALGGHSLYPDGRAGVFNSLYNVSLGDEIIVQDGEIVRRYIVNDIRSVHYTDVSVVYPTAHSRVTLITCDIPSFHAESGLYGERLVVIADAVN